MFGLGEGGLLLVDSTRPHGQKVTVVLHEYRPSLLQLALALPLETGMADGQVLDSQSQLLLRGSPHMGMHVVGGRRHFRVRLSSHMGMHWRADV